MNFEMPHSVYVYKKIKWVGPTINWDEKNPDLYWEEGNPTEINPTEIYDIIFENVLGDNFCVSSSYMILDEDMIVCGPTTYIECFKYIMECVSGEIKCNVFHERAEDMCVPVVKSCLRGHEIIL